jgi:hypothetical protein
MKVALQINIKVAFMSYINSFPKIFLKVLNQKVSKENYSEIMFIAHFHFDIEW